MSRGRTESGQSGASSARPSMPSFIVLHYSPFKAVWDSAIQILILYTALITPYMTTFDLYSEKSRMSDDQKAATRKQPKELLTAAGPSVIIDAFIDIVFVVDIVITFRTTFMRSGEIISDPRLIAVNFIKGRFVLDALAAIPFDMLLLGSGSVTRDSLILSGLLKLTRLIRLLRYLAGSRFSQYGAAVLLFLMSLYALIAHWLACIFYAIAAYEREDLGVRVGWIDDLAKKLQLPVIANDSVKALDTQSMYITSLYFSTTLLASVGFGNVAPNTDAEKIFSIFGMLIGSLLSAAIFGNVSSIMMRVYQGTEEFQEYQTSVKEFIGFHRVPRFLAKRLLEYWQYTWSQTNGIDMNAVLASFPQCLQTEICLHLNGIMLKEYPAFKNASQGCLRMLCMRFKTVYIPPNNFIIHRGEQLSAIYFIVRGCIEVLNDKDTIVILGKDDTFGDKSFVNQLERQLANSELLSEAQRESMARIPQTHSEYYVRAISPCNCNKIDIRDLTEILLLYPEFVKHLRKDFNLSFNLRTGNYVPRNLEGVNEDVLRLIHMKTPVLQTRNRTRTNTDRSTLRRFKMQEVSFGLDGMSNCESDMTDYPVYCGDTCHEKQRRRSAIVTNALLDSPAYCDAQNLSELASPWYEPPNEYASVYVAPDGQTVSFAEFAAEAYRRVDQLVESFEKFEEKILKDTEEMFRLVAALKNRGQTALWVSEDTSTNDTIQKPPQFDWYSTDRKFDAFSTA